MREKKTTPLELMVNIYMQMHFILNIMPSLHCKIVFKIQKSATTALVPSAGRAELQPGILFLRNEASHVHKAIK